MHHVAIDLGSSKSQVCVRDAKGTLLEQRPLRTQSIHRYLAGLPSPSRVIVETSAEAFHVADLAVEAGHEVRVVPATLVRSLGVGARGIKTDERDAQVLSEVSTRIDLPTVHVPSSKAREWRALCGSRDRLIATRTMLTNRVRGWLRTQTVTVRGRATKLFSERVRELAKGPEGMPEHIARLLTAIEHLSVLVAGMDRELRELTKDDLRLQRLMTVPGVGPVTAVRFVAAVDDISRFSGAHPVQSYIGLTPGERSSGLRTCRTGITKAGPRALRSVLVQAAWSALNSRKHRHDPMVVWARRISERRGKQVGAVALARKIAGILYAVWRDGGRYDATRGSDKTTG